MTQDNTVKLAFEEFHLVMEETRMPDDVRRRLQSELITIWSHVDGFMRETDRERQALARGDRLHKDHPPVHDSAVEHRRVPKRKSGFIDPLHRSEHQIAQQMDLFLTDLQTADLVPAVRRDLVDCLRGIVEMLDDRGVFFDQKKTFAAKMGLPLEYDETAPIAEPVPGSRLAGYFDAEEARSQRHSHMFFQRMNRERNR